MEIKSKNTRIHKYPNGILVDNYIDSHKLVVNNCKVTISLSKDITDCDSVGIWKLKNR